MRSRLSDSKGKITNVNVLISGAMGGWLAVLCTHPLDLLKTRFTVQSYTTKTYHSIWQAAFRILNEEGMRGFYKGLNIACIGVIPYEGSTFMIYEAIKRWFPHQETNFIGHMVSGSIAVTCSQIFSYPFDVVKKRMQASSEAKGMLREKYSGSVDCIRKILAKEGFLGLYKGTIANLLRVGPFAAIQFAIYEYLKRNLLENKYS